MVRTAHNLFIVDMKEDKQKEFSPHTLVIIGATLTIALVILSIITTTIYCTVMSRGRREAPGSDCKHDDCKLDKDSIRTS